MSTLDTNFILAEIFPRLPAKSVIRFKCVSKSFQAAISSRAFAQQYLRYHSASSNDNDLLIIPGNCSILCYNLNSGYHFTDVTTFTWLDRSISIIGSSNGLLCILAMNVIPQVFVLNPTTHTSMFVDISRNRVRGHNLGFAFDHVSLDFKIVVVSDYYFGPCYKTRTTQVYSLNTNTWSGIADIANPVDSMEGWRAGALINSHLLHWIFWNTSMEARIGCFNVCTMKWADDDVRFPRNYYNHDPNNVLFDFGVFDDCLFASLKNRVSSCFDVWVMKKYGVQDSWFKLLSLSTPIPDDFRGGVMPIARRGSDEILIRQGPGSTLCWYNSMNGVIREAEFSENPTFSNLKAYSCSSSTIDIPRGKIFGR